MNSAFAKDVNLGVKRKAYGRSLQRCSTLIPGCDQAAVLLLSGKGIPVKVQSLKVVSSSLGHADRSRVFLLLATEKPEKRGRC